jgi:predicted  nucleic acid-binding Zn-ribbon protein
MTVSASALREIHRIHRQISDLRGRLDRGPRQVKALEIRLQELEEKYGAAKESLQHTRISADDKQLQLRQREDRIKDLQGKLNSCSSNREYQTLKEQIAADEQANSVLSDEILEALERIDEQQLSLEQQEQERAKAVQEVEALRTRVTEQQSVLQAELERVTDNLQQAESSLPADIRGDYERIARVRGADALAQVDGGTCTGCYQVLSPQMMNLLMLARPQFCSSCGALLYMPEDEISGE